MALEITYWAASGNQNMPGSAISSESRSLSATSAQSGSTPGGCDMISVVATENARFLYASNPTADATSAYIQSGERLWFNARAGNKIAGITA